ncbi:hypothetical protein NUM_40760 [Actinocatenispora comari]|uniref:Uncharacterized protein n=1 Tax=Actinocatenispora comari TaxID=2807577 RepID=A0A8J4EL20_9ACTN|nr:hypothetical protein NUM_40760 [Actinocatenispora comari]
MLCCRKAGSPLRRTGGTGTDRTVGPGYDETDAAPGIARSTQLGTHGGSVRTDVSPLADGALRRHARPAAARPR